MPQAPTRGGRPAKHAKRFKLAAEVAEPDEQTTIDVKGKRLRIRRWRDWHYVGYKSEGVGLRPECCKAGTPVFAQPIWLFATARDAASEPLARACLWRSARALGLFVKRHLGLTKPQRPNLKCCDNCDRPVALAMTLLTWQDRLQNEPPPGYPRASHKPVAPRQAQKQALSFFLKLPKPTKATRPAGKAAGRAAG